MIPHDLYSIYMKYFRLDLIHFLQSSCVHLYFHYGLITIVHTHTYLLIYLSLYICVCLCVCLWACVCVSLNLVTINFNTQLHFWNIEKFIFHITITSVNFRADRILKNFHFMYTELFEDFSDGWNFGIPQSNGVKHLLNVQFSLPSPVQ